MRNGGRNSRGDLRRTFEWYPATVHLPFHTSSAFRCPLKELCRTSFRPVASIFRPAALRALIVFPVRVPDRINGTTIPESTVHQITGSSAVIGS